MEGLSPERRDGSSRSLRGGFTLLEVVVVLGIVAILAAIGGPAYQGYIERTRQKEAVLGIRSIEDQLSAYELEWEVLPPTLDAVGAGGMRDPWDNPYQYLRIAGSNLKGKGSLRKDKNLNPLNTDYDLYSLGPDGQSKLPLTAPQSHDDIVRAGDGSFIGVATDY